MPPFRKRTIRKAKKSYKRLLKKTAKKRTTRLIKRVVQRMAEKKTIQLTVDPYELANPVNPDFQTENILTLGQYNPALVIAQGTGEGNRIGNRIRIVSAWFKFILMPNIFDLEVNSRPLPQDVRLVIFKLKAQLRDLSEAQVTWNTAGNCFQDGNSASGLTGTVTDMFSAINTDVLTVLYDKVYKLGASSYDYAGSTHGAYYYGMNNDYKLNIIRRINLMKHGMAKRWLFEDNIGTTTFGYNPLFAVFIPVDAFGTANVDTVDALPIKLSWQLDLKFTDI